MTTFLALYRGRTIGEAKMVGVSVDPALVGYVASKLLEESSSQDSMPDDSVLHAIEDGRRHALQLIHGEEQTAR